MALSYSIERGFLLFADHIHAVQTMHKQRAVCAGATWALAAAAAHPFLNTESSSIIQQRAN